MKMFKVNDLFCGAGGMGLGFKQSGFSIEGAWDFDKYAVQSYAHNVGEHVKQADITQMNWTNLPFAHVWTFGFPCQDLSVAGKQAGMIKGKTRSGLFFEVMRLLDEINENKPENMPLIIMAENVKGLKPYLEVLEREYNQRGYKIYYTLYNSKFWGVPQNRERYFVVGVHESIQKEFVFPEQQESFVPKLSSILESEVDEKFYISDDKAQKIIEQAMKRVELKGTHSCVTPDRVDRRQNGRRAKEDEQEMFTLTAQDHHGVIEPSLNGPQKIAGMFDTEKSKHQAGSVWNKNGTSPTLDTAQGGYRQPLVIQTVKVKNQANDFVTTTTTSGTLLARDYKGFGNQEMDAVIEGFRVRKLTPREYARLQGFPDTFEFVCSNSQIYKQMGNAVTVNVARAIAERIKIFLLSL